MRWGFARNMVFVLALAVEVTAQTRPDFSGTWLLNAALSVGLRDDERKGVTMVVRQTDREIVFSIFGDASVFPEYFST